MRVPQRTISTLLLLLLIAACGESDRPPAQPTPSLPALTALSGARPSPEPLPETREECFRRGGTWGPQGLQQIEMCDMPTTDAGRVCHSSKECEGSCLAIPDDPYLIAQTREPPERVTGVCSSHRLLFSCHTYVEDGKYQSICAD